MIDDNHHVLTAAQIATFRRDGVLVVDNILSHAECQTARDGLRVSLARHGVAEDDLERTGQRLASLSSTNGSGGVLDIVYDEWRFTVATHPRFWNVTTQLWKALYGGKQATTDALDNNNNDDEEEEEEDFFDHPYRTKVESWDHGYVYLDRIGYRLPTVLSQQLGPSKKRPLQRSVVPHLDCRPQEPFGGRSKFRPIQSFISLSDTLEASQGGLEVARGFHRRFADWAAEQTATTDSGTTTDESIHTTDYTFCGTTIPVAHVPCRAGSAVFWDNRIPHANAYRHAGLKPRVVVYSSFLPAGPARNEHYVAEQLRKWQRGESPTDQWREVQTDDHEKSQESVALTREMEEAMTPLQRNLLGIERWT